MRATMAIKEHDADALGIRIALGAKVIGKPGVQAHPAVPYKHFEPIPKWMKRALACTQFDCIEYSVLTDAAETCVLGATLEG